MLPTKGINMIIAHQIKKLNRISLFDAKTIEEITKITFESKKITI